MADFLNSLKNLEKLRKLNLCFSHCTYIDDNFAKALNDLVVNSLEEIRNLSFVAVFDP